MTKLSRLIVKPCTTPPPLELSSLLGSRIGQVLEDYDPEKSREFYSEGGHARSDTVSHSQQACEAPPDCPSSSLQSDSDSEGSSLYRQKLQAKVTHGAAVSWDSSHLTCLLCSH